MSFFARASLRFAPRLCTCSFKGWNWFWDHATIARSAGVNIVPMIGPYHELWAHNCNVQEPPRQTFKKRTVWPSMANFYDPRRGELPDGIGSDSNFASPQNNKVPAATIFEALHRFRGHPSGAVARRGRQSP